MLHLLAQNFDIVTLLHSLLGYTKNYSETLGKWSQRFRDEPRDQKKKKKYYESFKFKTTTTGKTPNNVSNNIEITVSFKKLINFWRTLYLPQTDCEVNILLNLSQNYF